MVEGKKGMGLRSASFMGGALAKVLWNKIKRKEGE